MDESKNERPGRGETQNSLPVGPRDVTDQKGRAKGGIKRPQQGLKRGIYSETGPISLGKTLGEERSKRNDGPTRA